MSTTTEAKILKWECRGEDFFLRCGGKDLARLLCNTDYVHHIDESWKLEIRKWDGSWYHLGFSSDEGDPEAKCGFAVQKRLARRQLVAWPPESYGPSLKDTVPLVTSRPVETIEWQDSENGSVLFKNGVKIAYVHATGPGSNLPPGFDWEYAALNTEIYQLAKHDFASTRETAKRQAENDALGYCLQPHYFFLSATDAECQLELVGPVPRPLAVVICTLDEPFYGTLTDTATDRVWKFGPWHCRDTADKEMIKHYMAAAIGHWPEEEANNIAF